MSASSPAAPGTSTAAQEHLVVTEGDDVAASRTATTRNEQTIEDQAPAEPATSVNSISASSLEPDVSNQKS